jgi:hypothetical protein
VRPRLARRFRAVRVGGVGRCGLRISAGAFCAGSGAHCAVEALRVGLAVGFMLCFLGWFLKEGVEKMPKGKEQEQEIENYFFFYDTRQK